MQTAKRRRTAGDNPGGAAAVFSQLFSSNSC